MDIFHFSLLTCFCHWLRMTTSKNEYDDDDDDNLRPNQLAPQPHHTHTTTIPSPAD